MTRWGSRQKMIDRILEQAPAIRAVLSEDRTAGRNVSLTWQDMDVLTAINKALKPVAEFTDILSAEKYVTSSSILPLLNLCRNDVLAVKPGDVTLTAEIKVGIVDRLNGYYRSAEAQMRLRKCTILDPRYRDQIEIAGGGVGEFDEAKVELQAEMVTLAEREQQRPLAAEMEVGAAAAAAPTSPNLKKKKKSLGIMIQQHVGLGAAAPPTTPEQRAKREMTSYMREPVIGGEEDPLMWWKRNAERLPLLSLVAKKYLCVCATSTASERVFSTAGNIVIPTRNLLKPEKVDMLVFLAKNLEL